MTKDTINFKEHPAIGDSWDDFEKEIFTPEQIVESKAQVSLIGEFVKLRRKKGLTQKDLEHLSGIKQSMIARIEKGGLSTQINTLIKLLTLMGMKLAIVPMDKQNC